MNIIRDITHNCTYKGTYKLTFIDKYWWVYHYYEGDIGHISIEGREILMEWGAEERIEFREEDLYDN